MGKNTRSTLFAAWSSEEVKRRDQGERARQDWAFGLFTAVMQVPDLELPDRGEEKTEAEADAADAREAAVYAAFQNEVRQTVQAYLDWAKDQVEFRGQPTAVDDAIEGALYYAGSFGRTTFSGADDFHGAILFGMRPQLKALHAIAQGHEIRGPTTVAAADTSTTAQ